MHDLRLDTENPIHRGPLTLFALFGSRQNRTLNVSVLCPAKSEIVIPVSCVGGCARRAREADAGTAAAKRFFEKLLAAKRTTSPAVGLGTEAHLESGDLCGFALELDGTPVHLVGLAS